MRSGLLYQGLSALCFAIAILSFTPWASASSDEYYCKKGGDPCDHNCPSDKPKCEAVYFNCPNGPCWACPGCQKAT
jgi:hypothetical protein